MLRTCLVCKQEFKPAGEFKTRVQKYCSRYCWSHRRPPVINPCLYCGNLFKSWQKDNKKYCNLICRNKAYVGRKLPEGTKALISFMHKGHLPKNHWQRGSLHPNWNPNRTDYRERDIIQYKEWRIAVLKRDRYTCQICGYRGRKGLRRELHVDHILPFATHPELRTDLSNGRTLCVVCHHETETWGKKPIDYIKQEEVIKS